MTDRIEVRASYAVQGWFGVETMLDDAATKAAGRESDFSGSGFGERDLGWVCKSQLEAERISRALKKIGMRAEIRARPAVT